MQGVCTITPVRKSAQPWHVPPLDDEDEEDDPPLDEEDDDDVPPEDVGLPDVPPVVTGGGS